MPVSFDWEFQEGESSSQRRPGGDGKGERQRRRRMLLGGLALMLIVAGGWAVRTWFRGRVDALEKADAELRELVELELKTIADGDLALFSDRQDPNDSRWKARQISRFFSKSESFVPAPGLMENDRSPEIEQVHVLGSSGRAELTRWYDVPDGLSTDPLPFHSTWFYDLREDGSWYHVAPPYDYWGEPYTWRSSHLIVRATEVESELLEPIARDLSLLIAEGCQLLECPKGVRYTLSFEGDLAPRVQDDWWTLPALYLTGLPEGDEASAAWARALKLWMVEVLVQATSGGYRVSDRIFHRQLMMRFQAELGLSKRYETALASSDVKRAAAALLENEQNALQILWEGKSASLDPEEVRLLEKEVTLFLDWIEDRVRDGQLFKLLPAVGSYARLDAALLATLGLAPADYEAQWFAYVSELNGVTAEPVLADRPRAEMLVPPPVPSPPSIVPGNQIAIVCDDRIWSGNADGSNLVPLTAGPGAFGDLYWSPNGRWLLTTWLPDRGVSGARGNSERRALYLLAADGSGGRLLTDDPTSSVWAVGWSPDGRQAIYYVWHHTAPSEAEVWAIDVELEGARRLPGLPDWSPDGERLVYYADPFGESTSTVWLADADWGHAREIAGQVRPRPGKTWSPDGAKLALILESENAGETMLSIYDLATESFRPVFTPGELTAALLAYEGDYLSDGTDPAILQDRPLRRLWLDGWSADGSQLLVWAQATAGGAEAMAPTALAPVSLDRSPIKVLVFGKGGFAGGTPWSPSDPDRLTFVWSSQTRQFEPPNTYLVDLKSGPVYTASNAWNSSWSPDGGWVAFVGREEVAVVDQNGQARYSLGGGGSCSAAVWNPSADLSRLGTMPALELATEGWGFANVRITQDVEIRALHVLGELVNLTQADQRITRLVPAVRDRDGKPVSDEQRVRFPSGYADMIQTVGVAAGRSLPFGFTLRIPDDASEEDVYRVALSVRSSPAGRSRDDLDIIYEDFDLSAWPDRFSVQGIFDNPGQALEEYATVVVTGYDRDGRVIGWGWVNKTDPAYLMAGGHFFEVVVPMLDLVPEGELEVGSYKIGLFGR